MDVPRLEDTGRGLTVFYDRYLYSKRDPARRSISVSETAPVKPRTLYIIPSPLLGYGLKELLNRITDDSFIIAIEVSQALFHLCSPFISNELSNHPRLSIVRLSDENNLKALLDNLGYWRFRRVHRIDLNAGSSQFPENYNRLTEFAINALAAYWRNKHVLRALGRHWVRHLFANLSSSSSLQSPRSWTGKPIVVTGAGPSLEDSLNFLIQYRELVEIWATDTSLGTLLSAGIRPDVISVLDTQFWNHMDFHGAAGTGIKIIADITSYPGSLSITGGRTAAYFSSFAELSVLKRLEKTVPGIRKIPPLGSVGLSTVYLALHCSNVPIFLTGLDFAYTPGKTHARGSSMHKWQLINLSRINPSPGWSSIMQRPRMKADGYGQQAIKTDRVLMGYAELFRDRFEESERLYMLTGGVDLGIPSVDSSEALKLMIQVKKPEESVEKHPDHQEEVRIFLQNELQGLNQIIENWDNYNEKTEDAANLRRSLEEYEHSFCDFPNEHLFPEVDDVFLFQSVKRCRELKRFIQRVSGFHD